ncbi:MAG: hypothetical protein ABSG53_12240 [Thermoguttaceae bacterium]
MTKLRIAIITAAVAALLAVGSATNALDNESDGDPSFTLPPNPNPQTILFEAKADAEAGQPADKSPDAKNSYPTAVWISSDDGTRAKGFLEDRAAAYLPEQNLLQINRDFSVFSDTIAYCSRGFAADESVQKVIRDTVHSWFEQALVESVLGMRALRNGKEWSDRDIEKALAPEALTAAVMQRYHIIGATRDSLRRTLRGLPIAKKAAAPQATPRQTNCQQLDVAVNPPPALVLA